MGCLPFARRIAMGIRSDIAAALPSFLAAKGESANFTPSVGAPIPCMVFIDFNVEFQPAGTETQVWERGTVIEALLSEIGREPDRGETFTLAGGIVYTVKAILANDGLSVKAVVI